MASSVDRRIERYLPEDMGHCDPGSLIRPRSTDPIRACGQCRAIQAGHMTASDVRCRYAKNPCKPGAIHTCPRAARSADPWGAGLRGGEVVMLRVGDIDSKRMLIRVELGKGRKDRHAMLSPQLLSLLRAWWLQCRSRGWLFPLRQTTEQVDDVMFLDLESRVAKVLLQLVERVGLRALHSPSVELHVSQREPGNMAGSSREEREQDLPQLASPRPDQSRQGLDYDPQRGSHRARRCIGRSRCCLLSGVRPRQVSLSPSTIWRRASRHALQCGQRACVGQWRRRRGLGEPPCTLR